MLFCSTFSQSHTSATAANKPPFRPLCSLISSLSLLPSFQGKESTIRLAMDLIVYAYLIFDPECRGHIRKEEVLGIIAEKGQKGSGKSQTLSNKGLNPFEIT